MYRIQCLNKNNIWHSVGNLDQSYDANMIALKLSKFDDCSYRVLDCIYPIDVGDGKQIGLYVRGEVIEYEGNYFKVGDKI